MFRSKILPAAMAATILLGTTGAALAESHDRGLDRLGQEITAVLDAKVSAVQAIAAAEKETGGRATKVGIERDKNAYLYEVKTLSNGKVAKVFVDRASGKVVRTDDEGSISRFFESDDDEGSADLAKSPTTLAAAIATAERAVGGKAIEAGYRHEHHATRFDVRVVKNRIVYRVAIDPATGKVISGEAAGRDEHHDDGEHQD